MSIELTVSQNETKEQFIKERGKWKWSELWETILVLDEEILKAYSSLSSVPNKKGYVLYDAFNYPHIFLNPLRTKCFQKKDADKIFNMLNNRSIE